MVLFLDIIYVNVENSLIFLKFYRDDLMIAAVENQFEMHWERFSGKIVLLLHCIVVLIVEILSTPIVMLSSS